MLQPGTAVWCLLRLAEPKAVEGLVVQPGRLQTVVACAAQGGAEGEIAFYCVDTRHLQLWRLPGAELLKVCAESVERFAETSDATFMPTWPLDEELHASLPVEVRLAEDHRLFLWNSVLVVPDFLTRSECHIFMDAADRAACAGSAAGRFYSNQPGLNRYSVQKLDLEAQMLSESVLKHRLRSLLKQSSFAPELFDSDKLEDLKAFYSPGEPAVNRYITGGGIAPHVDREQITLNVVLSEPDAFQGGGTAFWPQRQEAQEAQEAQEGQEDEDEDEVVVLRLRQGSALLFNGQVTHAGRAVSAGIRHTFVASFSLVDV